MSPIASAGFPVPRTAPFGSALLAAVVATVVLSAGAASATLQNVPANCAAIGTQRVCTGVPISPQNTLETLWQVSDTGAGGDVLFGMVAAEEAIFLIFTEFVTGNALDDTGFSLSGLQGIPDLVPGELEVLFMGDWSGTPTDLPFVTNDMASVVWTSMAGADPAGGAVAKIKLNFVPEPGIALLLAPGLIGLGWIGRSRRH